MPAHAVMTPAQLIEVPGAHSFDVARVQAPSFLGELVLFEQIRGELHAQTRTGGQGEQALVVLPVASAAKCSRTAVSGPDS